MTASRCAWLACVIPGIWIGPARIAGQQPSDDPARPPKRAHHALTFDAARGEVVLFGGSTAGADESSIFFGDLWSWNGRRWQRLATTEIARSSHELVYDTDRERLLLFGGLSSAGPQRDLRVFDGKSWALLDGEPALAAYEPMVAYDVRRKCVVALGAKRSGGKGDQAGSVETWEFDGKEWTQAATEGPGPLHAASMVYDDARGVVLLFGGRDDQGMARNQTWEWDGSTWTEVATDGPPARFAAGLAFDAKRKQAVLFGGGSRGGRLGDTWLWDGERWHEVEGAGPPGRFMPKLAYDPRRSVTVMFGGRITYPQDTNDTWEWDGSAWTQIE